MHTTLITAETLQALLNSSPPPMVFDCSFELTDPAKGRAQYEEQHIPGARHADLNLHLSTHGAGPSEGRHPLPSRDQFTAWGVGMRLPIFEGGRIRARNHPEGGTEALLSLPAASGRPS